jgi:thiamine-phosphate pyrophosphorylase
VDAGKVRGLYGIADADASGGDPVRIGAALLAGGCRLVQLRAKGWSPDAVVAAGRALRSRCDAVGAVLVANDDPLVALAYGADGVHLGQTDGPVAAARRAAPTLWVGRSCNDLSQLAAAAAEGADYLAFGPVFDTVHLSRPKATRGLDALAEARRRTALPLVAIGGITADRLAAVRGTGVDAWAVIGAVCQAPDPVAATRALCP